jgi:sporulation integral membrane protein YlbJ
LGFIGGYPVGARTAISLYQNRLCSRTEAQRLLAFCNNSGPAFILGVVGTGVFADSRVGLLLYLIHAISSLFVGLLFRFYGREEGEPRRAPPSSIGAVRFSSALTGSVSSALQSVLGICAFVVFFSVVISLLRAFGIFSALAGMLAALFSPLGLTPEWATRLLTGALEISSGVWSLSGAGTLSGRLSMAAFMLGWAGISVHCQVLSFLSESGLSMGTYLTGKFLHALFSAVLSALVLRLFPLTQPVSAYLSDTVETLGMLDFSTVLSVSALTAGGTWMIFLLLSAAAVQKNSGKGRRKVV